MLPRSRKEAGKVAMPDTTVVQEIELIIEDVGGGGGKPPARKDSGGDDGEHRGSERRPSPRRYYTGIAVGMASIVMFFMALASVYIIRKLSSTDWVPVQLPAILWANTGMLLASSFTMEIARRRIAKSDLSGFRTFWYVTTALGIFFLVGQVIAWRRLISQGVFVASNPASSFFYIFTGAHALHLCGGTGALIYVAARKFENARVSRFTAAEVTSYYWHFMDVLWIFLLALLYLGK